MSDAGITSDAAPVEDESDAWRDDIALITPNGPSQWLGLPIAYFVLGAAVIAVLEVVWRGHGLNLQGWVLFAAACIFIGWSFPFAWFGRDADRRYELAVSQRYVRLKVIGASYLAVVATFVGIVCSAFPITAFGFVTLYVLRSQREVKQSRPEPTAFRRGLARIVERARTPHPADNARIGAPCQD
jgi:hypothetical protein